MNMNKWVADMLNAEVKTPMPILSFPSVQLMGITVEQLIGSSDLQAEGMKAVADRVKAAASVSMMDLSVEAEAFGSEILFSEDEVPTVIGAIVTDEDEANALTVPAVGAGRTGRYIEAIRKAKELITDRPVFAGVIGPFSLAGRLMGVSDALVNCYAEPDMVKITLEKTTEFLTRYVTAYRDEGADGVVMAEPLTGLLSPEMAAEFSSPYVKRIFDSAQTDSFIAIYHNCGGSTIKCIDSILTANAAAYHFGNAISMAEMLEHVPSDIIVMGNVDPAGQFKNGTPESIKAETLRIMSECRNHKNFVISSGCDIPPAASWENIEAFFEAARQA